jgi:hypothetical protein
MLTDHKIELERRAARLRQVRELPGAFGNFIAELAEWDWFVHLTFRDYVAEWRAGRPVLVAVTDRFRIDPLAAAGRLPPDPRIEKWEPSTRWRVGPVTPAPSWMLGRVFAFFQDLQHAAGGPIGFVLAEEYGKQNGRWHIHGLVTAVGHLPREIWWNEAFNRFGRCQIEPPRRAAVAGLYAAKYAAKSLGTIHFCGTLAGVDLSRIDNRPSAPGGRVDIACSPGPTVLYRMTRKRR